MSWIELTSLRMPARMRGSTDASTESRPPSDAGAADNRARRAATRPRSLAIREAWRRSRSGIAIVLLLTCFLNVLKLTLPLYIFQLLDRVIASRSVDTLLLLTAITVFAMLAASLAEFLRRSMLGHWGTWIVEHFGRQLFIGSIDRRRARRPGKALDDLATASGFVSTSALSSWLDALFAPAFLFIVYLIHPLLAGIVLTGMLVMLSLGIANETLTRPIRAEMRKARRRSEGWLLAAEQQLETVSGLSIGERLADRWHASIARRGAEQRISRTTAAAIGEAMRFSEAAQRIACYGVGVWLAIDGALSVGGIIAGAVLGRIGTSAVRRAMAHWRDLVLANRAYKRIKRRLDARRTQTHAVRDPDAKLSLHLDQVTFTHNAWSQPLFRQLDLKVEPGELLCIIGPSGSGKTTLARLIAGVAEPTMGTIRLGGLDITRFSSSERQALLGYLPQAIGLLDGTIAENIASLRSLDARRIVDAARLAGIHEVIEALPQGYETRIGSQKSPLSGGELRRLALARAIYGKPRLIVLDEPETNLDPDLVEHLTRSIEELRASGSAVVVTSQLTLLSRMASVSILLSRTAPSQIIVGTLDGNGISSSVEEERLHSHFPEQTGPLT
jgi:PrtD family type I secretion system ABC transporter